MQWILSRAIVLAVTVCALGLVAPSSALAHDHSGHAHGALAAGPSDSGDHLRPGSTHHAAPETASVNMHAQFPSAGTQQSAPCPPSGCGDHCCGGIASMGCCGAALAPDLGLIPAPQGAAPFSIRNGLPTAGLAPEALPKPPKSLA
jgi:hypothetical protein